VLAHDPMIQLLEPSMLSMPSAGTTIVMARPAMAVRPLELLSRMVSSGARAPASLVIQGKEGRPAPFRAHAHSQWHMCFTEACLSSATLDVFRFYDCDGVASNGCEAALGSDVSHGTTLCPNGKLACDAGYVRWALASAVSAIACKDS
jgi:hypothetical protein